MLAPDNTLELSPQNSHRRARELLTDSFFWDFYDENTPLGNDTGADTFAIYRQWRTKHPTSSVQLFIKQLLIDWEIDNINWPLNDGAQLQEALEKNYFSILTTDDFMIALAMTQLILEGQVDQEVRDMAYNCVQRQTTNTVISFRGWTNVEERISRLRKILYVLENI